MLETGITPDFISVDGGTAAAPLEFSNSLGMPARDAWIFVHNALNGVGLRDRIKIIASGKILTGFHMVRAMALGADACASALGMMFALGCIQSLRCNTNRCPTGVTTQKPALMYGLNVADKTERVARFQRETVKGCLELVGAMGLQNPQELRPYHIFRRINDLRVRHLGELYDFLKPGQLLRDADIPSGMRDEWHGCRPDRWIIGPEKGPYGGDVDRRETQEKRS